jgi:hypothetical protein
MAGVSIFNAEIHARAEVWSLEYKQTCVLLLKAAVSEDLRSSTDFGLLYAPQVGSCRLITGVRHCVNEAISKFK